ncbi:MAG: hypothetical protein IT427_13865 [Pirellulales bacterium]|nr:hypothetical protein [Pirellulales bacterium]
MSANKVRVPFYRRHFSGQAFVEFQGRRHSLGIHGSVESRVECQRFVEALAASELSAIRTLRIEPSHDLSIGKLTAACWHHVEGYFQKYGQTETFLSLTR